MNADMILIRAAEMANVIAAIKSVGAFLEREAMEPLPQPAFPSRPDIRREKKRTLILVKGAADLVAILEGGEVADEVLARALSREMSTDVFVVGLYESANAWARREYVDGEVRDQLFQPVEAFVGTDGQGWEGDASRVCNAWLSGLNWDQGFPLFSRVIGAKPEGDRDVGRLVLGVHS
jgi:hypothetical protein